MDNYSTEISSPDNLEFNGTFANVEGTYEIKLYDEDDTRAGEIYSVTFRWDYITDVPVDEIAAAMREYLGEERHNDLDWGNYSWPCYDTGITKFTSAPTGNCFDIQIFGSDRYIKFGLSTTSK